MTTIGSNDCVVGGSVSMFKPVLATVAEAMPHLAAEGGAVRVEAYLGAMRVVACAEQDALLVRVPSMLARGAMGVGLAELTRLLKTPASGQLADQFVLMALDGKATLTVGETVGESEHELTPVALSAVEPIVTSFPQVGEVAPGELLAVAECADSSDDEHGVIVAVGGGGITFGAVDSAVPIATVAVTDARQLRGDVEVLRLDAGRVAALARRFGDAPIGVRFTFVHDGAFVALVSGDGLVEAQLHATPVVR